MIRFQCPNCNAVMEAPDDKAGLKIDCKKCSQRLQIPAPLRNPTVLAKILPQSPPPQQLVPVQAPPPVRKIKNVLPISGMDEIRFLDEWPILVTNTRFVLPSTTYAMSMVTSVRQEIDTSGRVRLAIGALIFACVSLFCCIPVTVTAKRP